MDREQKLGALRERLGRQRSRARAAGERMPPGEAVALALEEAAVGASLDGTAPSPASGLSAR